MCVENALVGGRNFNKFKSGVVSDKCCAVVWLYQSASLTTKISSYATPRSWVWRIKKCQAWPMFKRFHQISQSISAAQMFVGGGDWHISGETLTIIAAQMLVWYEHLMTSNTLLIIRVWPLSNLTLDPWVVIVTGTTYNPTLLLGCQGDDGRDTGAGVVEVPVEETHISYIRH